MHPDELRAQLEALHTESFGWALACSDGERARAESVLQRSYLKVLEGRRRASSFQGRSSFKTWFFGVVRHTAAEERRRWIWRKLRLVGQESADAVAETRNPAEQSVFDSELHGQYRRLLDGLAGRHVG